MDDPNNCDANNILLSVHNDWQDGNSYVKSQVWNCSIYGQLGIEFSPFVSKSIPPYSPPADFNLDGVVDGNDFDIWRTAIDSNDPNRLVGGKRAGDANRDGIIDKSDFLIWDSTISPVYHAADFNQNGIVDYYDYSAWKSNYTLGGQATHAHGDADGDGRLTYRDFKIWEATVGPHYRPPADFNDSLNVDGTDFLIWQRNYNHGAPGSGAPIIDANFSDPNYARNNGDTDGNLRVDGTDFLCWQLWYNYPQSDLDGQGMSQESGGQDLCPPLVDYNGDGEITPDEVWRLFKEYFGEDWGS